jgi:NAD(P)-dependent dehydrogenase (short-subunit alcohol dehydrogenase family)
MMAPSSTASALAGSLAGKRAVITGAGSGIGREAARLFVVAGAQVALIGRTRPALDEAVAELGPAAFAVCADIARPIEIAAAMREVGERLGGVDILFANAGISEAPGVAEATESAVDAVLDINVKGTIFTVVHALPLLATGASIVLTGSVAARRGRPGDPIYAATKGAVRSFGRALAMDEDLLARRIRVNVLTPGAIATPLTRQATDDPAVNAYVAAMVPMGRWGQVGEVAQAALFLASDASSYMTGGEITVDGGLAHG